MEKRHWVKVTANICIQNHLWLITLHESSYCLLHGSKDKDKDKDLFIGPQEFVVGYSKAPEQPQSSARPMSFSHYDEDGARTSHRTHCCIGARRATHCATGDDTGDER